MDWLSANWIWILLIAFMLWMHLGMHRGHGGHRGCGGGHGRREREQREPVTHEHEAAGEPRREGPSEASGHRHGAC